MREDQDAKLRQILVAADMVDVDMRVDEKADIAIGDLSDSRHDLVGQRREQGVDEQHALGAGQHPDVGDAIRALDHVHLTCNRLNRQLDPVELPGLSLPLSYNCDDASRDQRARHDNPLTLHSVPPPNPSR